MANCDDDFAATGDMQLRKGIMSTTLGCNHLINSHPFHICLIIISVFIGFVSCSHVDIVKCLLQTAKSGSLVDFHRRLLVEEGACRNLKKFVLIFFELKV